ncbi:MAG: glutathione S-transferase family protein [Alphaproteobacteria bacterium]|nr:glutathione S-transferase family protein [Alphaproteobacteria bacterium]
MKLYYDPASTVCRPILLFLADHDLPVEPMIVDLATRENRGDWYLAVNPNGTVPALVDGGFRLTESATILRYLADLAGSRAYPAEHRARAKVDEALDWFNTGFYRDHGYGLVYPQILPHYATLAEPPLLAFHGERAAARLAVLDRDMIGANRFVAGNEISLADYFGAALVTMGEMIGYDLAPYPNVRRWLATMVARPGWAEANAAFYGWRSALRAAA